MIDWLLNKRIEIVVNPKPYDRWSWLGTKTAIAPSLYFLWGYDIGIDMNVLAMRFGPATGPHGVEGWWFDLTFERRGPIWRWPRARREWKRDAERDAKAAAQVAKWRESRKEAA